MRDGEGEGRDGGPAARGTGREAKPRRRLEVCVGSVDSAVAAAAGGADRLELNRALSREGLTPGLELYREVRESVRAEGHDDVPILVMIRPHDRGFVYDEESLAVMLEDVDRFLDAGASGVVFGPLAEDGTIHEAATRRLVVRARGRATVFHRAFDELADPAAGLRTLIRLGVDRVLTSGGARTALEGARALAGLRELAAGRIEILPGGGVTAEAIPALLEISGCDQVHGTFRRVSGPSDTGRESEPETDPARVAAARRALDSASP